jgi:Transglycosylase-like domain
MRNLLHRLSLLVAASLLATALLTSSFSSEPAGATTVSRRIYRPYRYRAVRHRVSRAAIRPLAVPTDDVWARLRQCESGGRYAVNTGNGFYGAYQFHPRTWRNLGYPGLPHEAPPEMQDEAARRLQARSGWGQWPVCSRRIGAR